MSLLARILTTPEQRSTLAVPAKWLTNALTGNKSNTGIAVSEMSSMRSSAVYACVRVLAETIASLPCPVYKRLEGGGKERVYSHPLYPVLNAEGNPEATAFTVRETLVAYLALWGNAYAEIEFGGGGQVLGLYPLRPDRMTPKRNDANQLRYEYLKGGTDTKELKAEHVLHIPGLGFNGLEGKSPIALQREAIALGMAAEEFGARFYDNDASPGGILTTDEVIEEEAGKKLKSSWTAAHSGLDNKHKVAVLDGGMHWEAIGIPPDDAQFIETRKFQVNEIARIFRIPPHMIQDLERATFDNIEHQSIDFVVHTIRPWLVRIEQALRMKLLTPVEKKIYLIEHLVDGLLRGDRESRDKGYATGRQNGWLNADEIREMENKNPIPDGAGQEYWRPLNMVGSNEEQPTVEEPVEEKSVREKRSQGSQLRIKISDSYRPIIESSVTRMIRKEKADVMKAANKFLKQRDTGNLVSWLTDYYKDSRDFVVKTMQPVVASYAEAIQVASSDEIGVKFQDQVTLAQFVNDYTKTFAARYTGRQLGRVNKVITSITENRDSTLEDDLYDGLGEAYVGWEQKKPAEISKEELVRLGGAVARMIFVAGGFTLVWSAGANACPFCSDLDGKVVGRESFVLSGSTLEGDDDHDPLTVSSNINHPPLHGGCVCTVDPA